MFLLMFPYILYCELRFADPTQPVDDEDLTPASLYGGGLELVLDLLELCVTPYEFADSDTL